MPKYDFNLDHWQESNCPHCHSHNLYGRGHTQDDLYYGYLTYECINCGASWREVTRVVGVEMVQDSGDVDYFNVPDPCLSLDSQKG